VQDKPHKEYLWKWSVVVALIIGVLTLIGIYIINPECYQKKIAQKQLEYGVKPSVSLSFEPGKEFDCESSYFLLKNQGPGRIERVWLVESVFLVESDSVHECPDLPHFEYYHFEGSLRSMGVLEAGDKKQIHLAPCWRKAMDLFFQKYSGKLVSRFTLTGNALAKPDFNVEFFFVIDPLHCDYISADNYIGGEKLIKAVKAYISSGPRSIIRWIYFKGPAYGFFKNPPKLWYTTPDSDYIPWYGRGLPPYELSRGMAVRSFFFDPYLFFPNKDSFAKFTWSCDSVVGPAAVMGVATSW
jgi:hypothetical protein